MAAITFSMDQRGEQLPPSRVAQSGRRLDQMAVTWNPLEQPGTGQPGAMNSNNKSSQLGPEWDGLGILVRDGYCDSPECLYCPSHTGRHRYEGSQAELSRTMFFPRSKRTLYANYQYLGATEEPRRSTPFSLTPFSSRMDSGPRRISTTGSE